MAPLPSEHHCAVCPLVLAILPEESITLKMMSIDAWIREEARPQISCDGLLSEKRKSSQTPWLMIWAGKRYSLEELQVLVFSCSQYARAFSFAAR
jgi:hypothetical protein